MSTANGKRAYTLGFGILLVLLLTLAAACTREVEVPGETVVVEKEVIKEVQVGPARPWWWRKRSSRPSRLRRKW